MSRIDSGKRGGRQLINAPGKEFGFSLISNHFVIFGARTLVRWLYFDCPAFLGMFQGIKVRAIASIPNQS
jgi:hypothetical protein